MLDAKAVLGRVFGMRPSQASIPTAKASRPPTEKHDQASMWRDVLAAAPTVEDLSQAFAAKGQLVMIFVR